MLTNRPKTFATLIVGEFMFGIAYSTKDGYWKMDVSQCISDHVRPRYPDHQQGRPAVAQHEWFCIAKRGVFGYRAK